jgi:8-oxo-dGTP diphosphatase
MSSDTDLQSALHAARSRGVTRFVAAAVFICKHRVLVLKRLGTDSELAGFWEIPGGHLEEGETVMQGLAREVAEETGLEIPESPKYLGHFDYTNTKGQLITQINFGIWLEREAVLSKHPEHECYRWIYAAQLTALEVSEETRRTLLNALESGASRED